MTAAAPTTTSLLDDLASIVGADNVLTDDQSVTLFAQDVRTKGMPVLAVVQPASTDELSRAVSTATSAGHAVIARGGGMSYTSGYVPTEAGSITIDMARMNKVLDINEEDMFVTVQCGCTWQDLHKALADTGMRTPFWGTLSGIRATVGGGMSQNGLFWGSARYGCAIDSLLSMEVVLADGSVVATGSAAQVNASPFFRHYGPDLSGLFCCDTGALGFKATATLKLIPATPARRGVSYDFDTAESVARAMSAVARADVAAECFAFDPFLQNIRMQRDSLVNDVKKLAGVAKASGSVLGAIKDSAKLAMAGRGYMKDVKYSVHILVEERIDAMAEHNIETVRKLCNAEGGREIEGSIPTVLRANPFGPPNSVLGPRGERWTPVHAILPHSQVVPVLERIDGVVERHRAALDEHGIGVGFLLALAGVNGFVVEPVFFTPDAMTEIHRELVEDSVLKSMPGFDDNPAARAATQALRDDIVQVFSEAGGIHMQIGKAYPYREGLSPESWRLVSGMKTLVDPGRRVNPGSLGLD